MIRKRQIKEGKTYKTKYSCFENGHVTVLHIGNDDIVEMVGDLVTKNNELVTRRWIHYASMPEFRRNVISEVKRYDN